MKECDLSRREAGLLVAQAELAVLIRAVCEYATVICTRAHNTTPNEQQQQKHERPLHNPRRTADNKRVAPPICRQIFGQRISRQLHALWIQCKSNLRTRATALLGVVLLLTLRRWPRKKMHASPSPSWPRSEVPHE